MQRCHEPTHGPLAHLPRDASINAQNIEVYTNDARPSRVLPPYGPLAIQEAMGGEIVEWIEPVTEEQYEGIE